MAEHADHADQSNRNANTTDDDRVVVTLGGWKGGVSGLSMAVILGALAIWFVTLATRGVVLYATIPFSVVFGLLFLGVLPVTVRGFVPRSISVDHGGIHIFERGSETVTVRWDAVHATSITYVKGRRTRYGPLVPKAYALDFTTSDWPEATGAAGESGVRRLRVSNGTGYGRGAANYQFRIAEVGTRDEIKSLIDRFHPGSFVGVFDRSPHAQTPAAGTPS